MKEITDLHVMNLFCALIYVQSMHVQLYRYMHIHTCAENTGFKIVVFYIKYI